MLNASKSTIGEIITEQDEECDHIRVPKSRRRSTSVEKLRSAQSGAIELFNSTLPVSMQVTQVRTNVYRKSPSRSPIRVRGSPSKRSPLKKQPSPVQIRTKSISKPILPKQKSSKVPAV